MPTGRDFLRDSVLHASVLAAAPRWKSAPRDLQLQPLGVALVGLGGLGSSQVAPALQ